MMRMLRSARASLRNKTLEQLHDEGECAERAGRSMGGHRLESNAKRCYFYYSTYNVS